MADKEAPNPVQDLLAKAKFRLLSAHYLPGDKWLPGDKENESKGDEMGTVVGAGTEHQIKWPTLEMEPLNSEAEQLLDMERQRLSINDASMNPIEDMPLDNYEENYVPGLNIRRGEPVPDGAPVKRT